MSLAAVPAVLSGIGKATAVGGVVFEGVRQLGGLFGFGSEQNIARNLSRELGCTIPQDQAAAARSFVAKGVNPCTMQPLTPQVAALRPEAPKAPKPVITVPPGGNGAMSVQAGIMGGGQLVRRGTTALAGVLRTTTGRISSIVLPSGAKFTRKRAAALIRRFGPEVAAAALGIGIIEAAEILLTESKTRRRRGITAAQVRNARRTACMVSKLARDLNVKPAPRRTSTCR